MKIKKKQNDAKMCDILPEFDNKSKDCFLNDEEFEDLSDHILSQKNDLPKEDTFSNVDQLDIMDISVSNFPFPSFNKIELDSLDIINDDNDEPINNFDGIADLVKKEKKIEVCKSNDLTRDANESIIKNSGKAETNCEKSYEKNDNNEDPEQPQLSKRALKRKQRLEESKVQCPVRTTARHYIKMFEFFELNPGVATGQLPKIPYRKKWSELTDILNDMKMGEKTTEKWQKTWSDYKLHLKKKLAGIKRSGKALDVPNQFTDQDRRALSIMGVCSDTDTDNHAIKKRFNPDTAMESEDSSSHSVVQSTTQNIPSSTVDINPTSSQNPVKKRFKFIKQQRFHRMLEKRKSRQKYQEKSLHLQIKTLKELRLLKSTLNRGLNRIGDILQIMVKKSESSNVSAFAEAATAIVSTAGNFAEIVKSFDRRCNGNGHF